MNSENSTNHPEKISYLLHRNNLSICFVEEKAMKRLIRRSIFQLLGRADRSVRLDPRAARQVRCLKAGKISHENCC